MSPANELAAGLACHSAYGGKVIALDIESLSEHGLTTSDFIQLPSAEDPEGT